MWFGKLGNASIGADGCVTTLRGLRRKSPAALEDALGYKRGMLAGGYLLYALDESVAVHEFDWLDTTRYSGGWQSLARHNVEDRFKSEHAQRWDVRRFALAQRYDFDEAKTDQALRQFQQEQCLRLNERLGQDRIVKVFALAPRSREYPDSGHWNIPQWRLRTMKRFRLLGKDCLESWVRP